MEWVKEGEGNASFFHRMASGKRSKNTIGALENDRVQLVREEKEVKEEILSLFTNLYDPSKAVCSWCGVVPHHWEVEMSWSPPPHLK